MSDLVARLRENSNNWRRQDPSIFRESEEDASLNEEAAERIEQLERELIEHQDAKWKERHVDTMNDMASLRIALEGAEAALAEARRQAFEEAAQIAELEGFEWVAKRIRAKSQPHSETRQEQR